MNKKGKERTGFIVRNIKTEKRDAQNGGADKMGNVKMISPAVPNMPWQERPEKIVNAPVWRYKENPIIGRNPVEGVARIFNRRIPWGADKWNPVCLPGKKRGWYSLGF